MKKHLWLALAFILVALIAGACDIQVNASINADGSGKAGFALGFSENEIDTNDLDPDTLCEDLVDNNYLNSDYEYNLVERDNKTWCETSESFDDLRQLKRLFDDVGIEVQELSMDDEGRFTFDAAVNASVVNNFVLEMTIPGAVDEDETNADEISGRTLTWEIDEGDARKLHAESQLGGINVALIVILLISCLCLLVLAGGGVAAFFLIRKRRAAPAA